MPHNRRRRRSQPPLDDEPQLISAENSQHTKLRIIAYSRNLSHIVTDLRPPGYWKHFGQGAIDELNDQPWRAQIPLGYRNGRRRVYKFQKGRYPEPSAGPAGIR
jgi:hypothetical protein